MKILSIGGSDPSSGAGIQGDIKSCESLGAYCLTAVTGVTSQNTREFGAVEPVSARILKEQIGMLFSDFEIDAVKIGMVYSQGIIRAIRDALNGVDIPIILDPVIKSTSGGMLIREDAVPHLKRLLIPISAAITPNKFEAEFLTGIKIRSEKTARMAAEKLQKIGAENVVITGLAIKKGQSTDYVLAGSRGHLISQRKIPGTSHGGGCVHSLALCYCIARKEQMSQAALFAMQFASSSIRDSRKEGSGYIVYAGSGDKIYDELSDEIGKFIGIKNAYKLIPECQTNFVYSKIHPASTKDVLGIQGRIVRSGKKAIMAGRLEYGGSRHVAAAVLAASKKFPVMRAAVNLRFQENIVSKMRKKHLVVLSYNRASEPHDTKNNEGMSVEWGTNTAISSSRMPPDAIFHRGDIGKEPMIIIFGRDPADVTRKVQMIASATLT